jgi:glycosyltransferase involved in cell wall biosynthesis
MAAPDVSVCSPVCAGGIVRFSFGTMRLRTESSPEFARERRIVVVLPCYNEEITIARVVADFRAALPAADIYVFDNNSDDDTARLAAAAGAVVVASPRRGKRSVVQHIFRTIDADVYVMADGDGTYPADRAGELIHALESSDADMVVGTRLQSYRPRSFRALHTFGNRLISGMISRLFSARVTDVLSGYRVLDERLVRALRLQSTGFEIETEMTLQTLIRGGVIKEVPVPYGERPAGSHSKLNTFSDGALVFKVVFLIFKDYRPLVFFSGASAVCFLLGLVAGWYPIDDYMRTRFVSHVPLALLAAALEVLAVLFLGIGLILNAITKFHLENQELIRNLSRRQSGPRDPR